MKNQGQRLKQIRKHYGFTQTQLADYLGVKQGQIAKIENGQRKIKPNMAEQICRLFKIDDVWFVYGEGGCGLEYDVKTPKRINPHDIANMNKIISNIEYLSDVTSNIKEES